MPAQEHATVAVTGATGALGSRIAARLADNGVPQLLVGRDPDRLPELPGAERRGPAAYDEHENMRHALDGASTLVLVSSHPTGRRLEEHAAAVQAGKAVGVSRVLYVSLIGSSPTAIYRNARDHWLTEQFLAGSGLHYTIFRAGLYISTPAALADEDFAVRGPGGTGEVAFVAHDDIANVIATVARDQQEPPEHDGAILEVTGPETMTLETAVQNIADATGQPYHYVPETLEEAFARRWQLGISGTQIESWISWYQAIASNTLCQVTDVVPRITGAPATPPSQAGWWPTRHTAR